MKVPYSSESTTLQLARLRSSGTKIAVCLGLAAAAVAASVVLTNGSRARPGFSRAEVPFLGTQPGEERDRAPAPKPAGPALPTLTAEEFEQRLFEFRGRPVVVNFWASWCGPCRQEAPDLLKLERKFSPLGVAFIGINLRDDPAGAGRFIKEFRLRHPNFSDFSGQISRSHRIVAIPTTLLVAPGGKVVHRSIGAIDPSGLAARLAPLAPGHRDAQAARPPVHNPPRKEVRP